MTGTRVLLVWATLLLGVALELLGLVLGLGAWAPLLGLALSAVIVAIPMELPAAPPQARIFALAGLFWLAVMLFGLGTLEPLTRHDQPLDTVTTP